MKNSLAPTDFAERLVPRIPTAPVPQEPDRAEPAAPSAPVDGAAFSHFTESFSVGAREKGETVRPDPSAGRTVAVCDHTLILLRAVADYEQCSNEHAVALALAAYATKIGAGPLARAVLDERERGGRGRGSAGGRSNGSAGDDVAEDIHDLPDFERRQLGRFSRAREALRKGVRG